MGSQRARGCEKTQVRVHGELEGANKNTLIELENTRIGHNKLESTSIGN